MLPYPPTSRRVCTSQRCPRITTLTLLTILFACVYHSHKLLIPSNDEPKLEATLDGPDRPTTLADTLQPAVEVVEEVDHQHNAPNSDFHNLDISVSETLVDKEVVSQSDNTETDAEHLTGGTDAALDDDQPQGVSRSEDQALEADDDLVPAVEKNDADSADDAAPLAEDAPQGADELDRQEGANVGLTDEVDSEEKEVPAAEKQEHKEQQASAVNMEATVVTTEAEPTIGEVSAAEKRNAEDDSTDSDANLDPVADDDLKEVEKQDDVAGKEIESSEEKEAEKLGITAGHVDSKEEEEALSEKEEEPIVASVGKVPDADVAESEKQETETASEEEEEELSEKEEEPIVASVGKVPDVDVVESEKQETETASTKEEPQGDYGLEHEEKQEVEPMTDEERVEASEKVMGETGGDSPTRR